MKIFRNQNNIDLEYFADIRFGMFLVQIDRQKMNILGKENSAMYSNDVVVHFNDVIRNAHCALNIESTQHVAILTFKWTL